MRALFILLVLLCPAARAPAQPARWTATRDLRIGDVDDPEYTLTYARSILIDRNGNIYSLHPSESLIRVFGADGRLRSKIGRKGSGPGEFSSPWSMGWKGDTLWVDDPGSSRISFFASDGEFLSTLSTRSNVAPGSGALAVRGDGLLADGSISARISGSADAVASGTMTMSGVLRMSRDAQLLDTLVMFSLRNSTHRIMDPDNPRGMRSYGPQPFSDAPIVNMAHDRNSVYVVDRIAAANSRLSTYSLTRIDLKGDTVFRRTYNYMPLRLAKAEVDSAVALRVKIALMPRANLPANLQPVTADKLVRRELFVPEFLPPVQELVPGSDGTVWLQRENRSGSLVRWDILDGDGKLLGSVELPRRFRVVAATRSFAIGEEYDDLDVPYITRYRFSASPARR